MAKLADHIVPEIDGTTTRTSGGCGWENLSDQERTIAWFTSQAMTNRQIAHRVFLSPHTVNYHLRQIFRKLGINSRIQLAGLTQSHLAEPRTVAAPR
jgi:DNA-binding CsgD family transcriptional regulator